MNDRNCIFGLSGLGILSLTIKMQAEKDDGKSVKVVICTQQHLMWMSRLPCLYTVYSLLSSPSWPLGLCCLPCLGTFHWEVCLKHFSTTSEKSVSPIYLLRSSFFKKTFFKPVSQSSLVICHNHSFFAILCTIESNYVKHCWDMQIIHCNIKASVHADNADMCI